VKAKVLLAAEFTGLSTGYGNYGRELLNRLQSRGFEVGEFSSYTPDLSGYNWPVFGVEPPEGSQEAVVYGESPVNQFGRLRFEQALLRYQPTHVLTFRDVWADSHVADSPFRPFFKWIHSPTCDSVPQASEWLSFYQQADICLAYTDWAIKVISEQSGGAIPFLGSATPIPDDCFVPIKDKRGLKASLGLDQDGLIVGTTNRNQPRKLHPDLMEAFAIFLKVAPKELAARTTLWFHTSYPDIAWNMPELLMYYGLASKVLFSYICHGCDLGFPAYFSSAKTLCPRCGGVATMPSTQKGVSRERQVEFMQSWDISVNMSVAEGLGMFAMESAACGVPVAATDYSAMEETVRRTNGFPIPVERYFWDHGTGSRRALPDNAFLASLLVEYLSMPAGARAKKGFEVRRAFEQNYSWDKTVDVWAQAILQSGMPEPWNSPRRTFPPVDVDPTQGGDDEFVERCIKTMRRDDLLGGHLSARISRDLAQGCRHAGQSSLNSDLSLQNKGVTEYNRNDVLREFGIIREFSDQWEARRAQEVK
jgi:glycosyltransferase involved in cell wall biosynthesis